MREDAPTFKGLQAFKIKVHKLLIRTNWLSFDRSFGWVLVGVSSRNLVAMQFVCQWNPPELCFGFGGKEGTFVPLFSLASDVKFFPGLGVLKSGSPLVSPRGDFRFARLPWRSL